MGNGDLLYSVKDLFTSFLDGRCFNIPEYQRGYKWTKQNVQQLLTDLDHFTKQGDQSDQFYCLQNITLTEKMVKGKNVYQVVDGQQRLTTLFIILSYLKKFEGGIEDGFLSGKLQYSIRESTNEFLQGKKSKDGKEGKVLTGKIWEESFDKEPGAIDEYYIIEACQAVQEWFNAKNFDEEHLKEYADKVLNDLKLIVNVVNQEEEEIVFANLNGGKVDLDGADLMRAILITRATKQKYSQTEEKEKVEAFRVKLGMELDEIAAWWSQDDVMGFFKRLLPNKISENPVFVSKYYPIDLLYFAFFEAYRKELKASENDQLDLRTLENGIDINQNAGDDHLEFYNLLKEFNLTMQDWYQENEIYNLLGYLMSNFKGEIKFSDLWNLWNSSGTKVDFKNKLKSKIKDCLLNEIPSDDKEKESNEDKMKDLLDAILPEKCLNIEDDQIEEKDLQQDWYYDPKLPIERLLPLADIILLKGDKRLPLKFMAKISTETDKEDKEHIRSQCRKLYTEGLTPENVNTLENENKKGLNSIGNIVLLERRINRGYGNEDICLKMDRIFKESSLKNSPIRPYTFEVFKSKLENMDENGISQDEIYWSLSDIARTAKNLRKLIADFLNV